MATDLQKRFELDMQHIYRKAKVEAKYNATPYLHMLHNYGGLETAHVLINSPNVSEGYTALWERGRLDLMVEALIYNNNPEYHELFTKQQLKTVKQRLIDYQYPGVTDAD